MWCVSALLWLVLAVWCGLEQPTVVLYAVWGGAVQCGVFSVVCAVSCGIYTVVHRVMCCAQCDVLCGVYSVVWCM